jgi:hypothetical protein
LSHQFTCAVVVGVGEVVGVASVVVGVTGVVVGVAVLVVFPQAVRRPVINNAVTSKQIVIFLGILPP